MNSIPIEKEEKNPYDFVDSINNYTECDMVMGQRLDYLEHELKGLKANCSMRYSIWYSAAEKSVEDYKKCGSTNALYRAIRDIESAKAFLH